MREYAGNYGETVFADADSGDCHRNGDTGRYTGDGGRRGVNSLPVYGFFPGDVYSYIYGDSGSEFLQYGSCVSEAGTAF